jgi:hypothetical protein
MSLRLRAAFLCALAVAALGTSPPAAVNGAALASDITLAKASTVDAEVIVKRTLAFCRYCAAAPHLPVRCQSLGGIEGSSVGAVASS